MIALYQETDNTARKFTIRVRFEGVVTVEVPGTAKLPEILARKIALSRVLATVDNPDAPDDVASEEYLDELEKEFGTENVDEDEALTAWDCTRVEGIAGAWEVEEIR